jgi:hypothetical protein
MKFKILICIVTILISLDCQSQVFKNVITDGGAIGNGIADDTQAIQNTIDMVSNLGGGTVYFPGGTYLISPIPNNDPFQVICIDIADNIELLGDEFDESILKLMDNAGNYDAIIGKYPSYIQVDNVILKHLTIDANSQNNEVTDESVLVNFGSRSLFRIFLGENHLVEDCHFTNSQGTWNVVYNGITNNITIRNNLFDNIGSSSVDWDHSTIYTNGNDFLIENNEFYSLNGVGTLGARTAVETHGSNQIMRNNYVNGYVYGVNVTGYSDFYLSDNQYFYGNTFDDVAEGFVLWSGLLSDPAFGNGLTNVKIFENIININAFGWKDWIFFGGGGGIVFSPYDDRDVENLFVFENDINFTGLPLDLLNESVYSSGLRVSHNINPESTMLSNFYFSNNRVSNSNGPGIYVGRPIENCLIANNEINNVGSSTAAIFEGFRSGIFMNDIIARTQISCNYLNDNTNSGNTFSFLYQNYLIQDFAYFIQNGTNVNNLDMIFYGNDHSGPFWDEEPNIPEISLSTNSVMLNSGTATTVQITLDNAISMPLVVNLIPIDREDNYGTNWISDLQVEFLPGETSKNINVSNLLTSNEMNSKNYLIVEINQNYTISCNPILEVILMDDSLSVIDVIKDINSIKAFPNPTNGVITLENLPVDCDVTVFDIMGKNLTNSSKIIDKNKLDLSRLIPGVYFIQLTNYKEKVVKKIIKIN